MHVFKTDTAVLPILVFLLLPSFRSTHVKQNGTPSPHTNRSVRGWCMDKDIGHIQPVDLEMLHGSSGLPGLPASLECRRWYLCHPRTETVVQAGHGRCPKTCNLSK